MTAPTTRDCPCRHAAGSCARHRSGFRTIRQSQSLVCETGGFDPTAGCIEMAVREVGADRVIFGSDTAGRSFASQLAKVQGADVPADAKQKILGENLKRMLDPILKAKGMKP